MSADVVIRGGTVIDGTGAPGYRADVAITDGVISGIGTGLAGRRELDAAGHVIQGFSQFVMSGDFVIGIVVFLILITVNFLVITKGENGCTILTKTGREDVKAVPPHRIEDPTGVGDAFRGGFMKGLAAGASDEICGRLGSVAATYALEHLGGSAHSYTWSEFVARYEQHFGKLSL